ncbi:MAG TPA: alpha-1,4-glucan--maltose-1-phosphate maltosyltransferase [Actinomycetota bacterium]|nr:alpha-1,4-glucan--maltose-1-phosphate maltosyltransferase [Actinomycetota bacterium]
MTADHPSEDGRRRAVIDAVRPEVDAGRFPVKRTVGEQLVVEADAFCDGHDRIAVLLRWKAPDTHTWRETPMRPDHNDVWRGSFPLERMGRYAYTVEAWVDHFATWRYGLAKKVEAGQDVSVELLEGGLLLREAAGRASGDDAALLLRWADRVARDPQLAMDSDVAAIASRYPDRSLSTTWPRELEVAVDRERARFSAWYELFPRSWGSEGRHGTLSDVADRLDYVAGMGFDIVYLPPIHPIGTSYRKGRNNTLDPTPDDVGSPWAIGAPEGGHTALHPDLGDMADLDRLVARARELDMEVALDLAYQCSPDHPWVAEHPEWFKQRPDGTIQYAENPPKKYQDIYPIDFESQDWENLWRALADVVWFWIGRGIKVFRVDNPHTKAFAFWEWMIGEVHREHPDVIFLSEAFTRPKVMYRLAKLGFTQSYTYFTWRNTKSELTEYFTELTSPPVVDFFRPNLWPNTPDILHETLQTGGRGAFMARLVLAATLGASYGIYGPAFELMEHEPVREGSEEYLHSEKYEIRSWDLKDPDSLAEFISRVNGIRRSNPALRSDRSLRFHHIDNEQLIAYTKREGENLVCVVVNLDPFNVQSGWVHLPTEDLGIDAHPTYQVHDLLTDARYQWQGDHNFVQLDPGSVPAHVFRIATGHRTERDFESYL